jgi:hypothetical protein
VSVLHMRFWGARNWRWQFGIISWLTGDLSGTFSLAIGNSSPWLSKCWVVDNLCRTGNYKIKTLLMGWLCLLCEQFQNTKTSTVGELHWDVDFPNHVAYPHQSTSIHINPA